MKAFYALMAVCICFSTSAQSILSGKVTDTETQQPLPGAHVYFPDLQKGATTNQNGFFEIKDLPKGSFLVQIGYVGYDTELKRISIDGANTMDIALSPSITEISEVVVTGTSASTEREINPIPTAVETSISTNDLPSTNLIDAISAVPGVSQITTGGGISKPVIRGLGYNRVVVLNNHIRQEGQQWGDEHGVEVDQYSVDRVEIVKGPGSVMYGSDAIAGVIHFLSPKPVEEGKIIGSVLANYQTNNDLGGFSAMNAGNLKGIYWRGRVSRKIAGNYKNPVDGIVYNSAFKEFNFNGAVGVNRQWGFSELNFSRFGQTLGLVEGERDSMGNFLKPMAINDTTVEEVPVNNDDLEGYDIDIPKQRIEHLRIGTSNKIFIRNSILTANVAFQQNRRKEFADPLEPEAEELFFILNTANYDVRLLLSQMKQWQTSIGLNGMWQYSRNEGEEFLIPEYRLWDGGIYLFTQKSFNKLFVSGGLRYDIRSINSHELFLNDNEEPAPATDPTAEVKFKGFNTKFSNFSGSAGASYRFNEKITTKLNIARGFRSPNMAELASNGIHEGTFRYEIGNSTLKAETSLQVDAGLLFNSDHVSFELAAFHNSIDNYIYLQKLNSIFGGDSIVEPTEPAPTFTFVQGHAKLYGGEVVIDIHPHPLDWLHFENSFSIVKARQSGQADSARYLPFIPAPKLRSELRADFSKVGKGIRNFFVKLEVEHTLMQDEVFSAFNTETPTESYTLMHAAIGMNIINKNNKEVLRLSVAAHNIFDVAYFNHLSRLKYAPENPATGTTGIYNMGRNLSLQMVVPVRLREQ